MLSLCTEGREAIQAFLLPGSDSLFLIRERAELRILEAEYALRMAHEPVDLRAERQAVEKELTRGGEGIDQPDLAARLALVAIRGEPGKARAADFEAALAFLKPVVTGTMNDPRAYHTLAEIHAERAAWLEGRGEPAEADVKAGLALVEKVLGINPHNASAFVTRGKLFLVRARATRGEERKTAARAASEAFAAALRENPRLAAEVQEPGKEAAGLGT